MSCIIGRHRRRLARHAFWQRNEIMAFAGRRTREISKAGVGDRRRRAAFARDIEQACELAIALGGASRKYQ